MGTPTDIVLMSGGSLVMLDPLQEPQSFYFGRAALSFASGVEMPRVRLPLMRLPDPVRLEPETAGQSDFRKEPAGRQTGNKVKTGSADKADSASEDSPPESSANKDRDSEETTPRASGNGTVFMTQAFHGAELSRSDLQGAAVFVPTGAGVEFFAGPERPVMLLGINAAELMMGLSSITTSGMAERAIAQARAVLLLDGVNVGAPRNGSGVLVGHLN